MMRPTVDTTTTTHPGEQGEFPQPEQQQRRSLIAVAAGHSGQSCIESILQRFPANLFDVMIFSYDNTVFVSDPMPHVKTCFNPAQTPMRKYDFAREYLAPGGLSGYEYLFLWDDDAELSTFDPVAFLNTVRNAKLDIAMPALTTTSHHSHPLTLQQPGSLGRYTDFVEISFPVFTQKAWRQYYRMIAAYNLPYPDGGGGYDDLAFSYCNLIRQGIIDSHPITHTKPVNQWSEKKRRIHHLMTTQYLLWPAAQRVSLARFNEYDETQLAQLIDDYRITLFETHATILKHSFLDKTLENIQRIGQEGKLPSDFNPNPLEGVFFRHNSYRSPFYQGLRYP